MKVLEIAPGNNSSFPLNSSWLQSVSHFLTPGHATVDAATLYDIVTGRASRSVGLKCRSKYSRWCRLDSRYTVDVVKLQNSKRSYCRHTDTLSKLSSLSWWNLTRWDLVTYMYRSCVYILLLLLLLLFLSFAYKGETTKYRLIWAMLVAPSCRVVSERNIKLAWR